MTGARLGLLRLCRVCMTRANRDQMKQRNLEKEMITLASSPEFQKRFAQSDNDPYIPDINGICFINETKGWIGTEVEGYGLTKTIYYTTNAGQSWGRQYISGAGSLEAIQFLPDGLHGWISGRFNNNLARYGKWRADLAVH